MTTLRAHRTSCALAWRWGCCWTAGPEWNWHCGQLVHCWEDFSATSYIVIRKSSQNDAELWWSPMRERSISASLRLLNLYLHLYQWLKRIHLRLACSARILFQRLTDMLSIQVPGEDEHCNRDELSTQMSGHSHNELTLAVRVSAVRSLALWQRNAKGKGHWLIASTEAKYGLRLVLRWLLDDCNQLNSILNSSNRTNRMPSWRRSEILLSGFGCQHHRSNSLHDMQNDVFNFQRRIPPVPRLKHPSFPSFPKSLTLKGTCPS